MCNDLKMFRLVGVSLENFFLLQWLCLPGSTTKDSGGGVPIENWKNRKLRYPITTDKNLKYMYFIVSYTRNIDRRIQGIEVRVL